MSESSNTDSFCSLERRGIDKDEAMGFGPKSKPFYIIVNILSIIVNALFVFSFFAKVNNFFRIL